MEGKDLLKLVNQILAKRGIAPAKDLAKDFADGILYEKLFNVLYDERVNCHLVKSPMLDVKMQNWNKINATICFNYLQQQFYMVAGTMKSLAQGKNEKVTSTMIKHLINSTQGTQFETFLDDEGIRDIADVVETEQELYSGEEKQQLNSSHAVLVGDEKDKTLMMSEHELMMMKSQQHDESDDNLSRGL